MCNSCYVDLDADLQTSKFEYIYYKINTESEFHIENTEFARLDLDLTENDLYENIFYFARKALQGTREITLFFVHNFSGW